MATALRQVLEHLGGPSDGQLLARFVATHDEAAFAALVRRHGPLVLGVCRRVLRHEQDAEDAFQATFFVLARKAASVVKRESLGSWLYQVAYRTALEASAANARRRAKERPMPEVPHPQVQPVEAQDWRPLLDRELNNLPTKYREAVVLCDLGGRSRREAARQLGLPEGTLSGRLTTARRLLARRLARYGLAPAAGVAALAPGATSARVPAALVWSTAQHAALVAAGRLATAPGPAVVLMKGVMTTMFLKRLKLVAGVVMVAAALGMGGVAYQAGSASGTAQAAPDAPVSELDALRKENDLLKLNLQVVLEKLRSQEEELRNLRAQKTTGQAPPGMMGMPGGSSSGAPPTSGVAMMGRMSGSGGPGMGGAGGKGTGRTSGEGRMGPGGAGTGGMPGAGDMRMGPGMPGGGRMGMGPGGPGMAPADPIQEAEAAVKALREARDAKTRQRATRALERALRRMKEQETAPRNQPLK
jgi:RNA polymerase sigma factor (sigma-70 family)